MNITMIAINILLKLMEAIGDISCDPLSNSLFYTYFMVIQQDKKTDKIRAFSPQVINATKMLTYSSQFQRKTKKNIIKIHLPFRNTQTSQKRGARQKFSHIDQTNYSSLSDVQQENDISKSTSFKPSLQHKKTYSNTKYLLQVFHKKYRAKTITQKFYSSNYQLDMSIESKKGFKGGKLADYSLFKNMKLNKIQIKGFNQNFQHFSDNAEYSSQEKSGVKFIPYVKQEVKKSRNQIGRQIGPQLKLQLGQERTESSLVKNQLRKQNGKYQNRFKTSSLNASLNLYRKKFNQLKKNKMIYEQNGKNSQIKQYDLL